MQVMCATDVNVFQRLCLLWLCLLSVAITPYFSYHIECNQTRQCEGQTLSCPSTDADDTDCSVTCSAVHSCESTTIDCSHSSSCDVNCTQYAACEALTLICPLNGTCNLRCVGDESDNPGYQQRCEAVTVTASTASLVNVTCIGSHVCQGGLAVDCGESLQCNVRCHGDGACDGTLLPTEIDGSHATQLRLLGCDGETGLDTPACNSMKIRCPSYDAQLSPQCFIPGDGSYAVYGQGQSGGPLTVLSGGIDIYARHSWQDIMFTHDESNHGMFPNPIAGTMYCEDPDDRYSCDIVTQVGGQWDGQWDCRNASLLCSRDQYTTDPTMEPTFVPSMLPTLDPTVDPTQIPTSDPTVSPTADPTSAPTSPTQTPTEDPTSEPTVEPTLNPIDADAGIVPVYGRFGLLIGMTVIVVFICLIGYVWKWWNKEDTQAAEVAQLQEAVHSNRNRNRKKAPKPRKPVSANDGGESEATAVTAAAGGIGKKKKKKKNRAQELLGDGAVEIEMHANDEDEKKATKAKKKKKKKKKAKDDKVALMDDNNAGDYQQQNDDPFETNQWTELDKFD